MSEIDKLEGFDNPRELGDVRIGDEKGGRDDWDGHWTVRLFAKDMLSWLVLTRNPALKNAR